MASTTHVSQPHVVGSLQLLRYVPHGRGNHWLQIDGRDYAAVLSPAARLLKVGDLIAYRECDEGENRRRRIRLGYSPLGAIKFVDVLGPAK